MGKSVGLSFLFFNLILEFYDPSSDLLLFFFNILKLLLSLSLSFKLSKEYIIVISDFFLTFLYCFWGNI
jgi:hypothetical protein